jgi:hypothetical protein
MLRKLLMESFVKLGFIPITLAEIAIIALNPVTYACIMRIFRSVTKDR